MFMKINQPPPFRDAFELYSSRTDGKEIIAEEVKRLTALGRRDTLLDIGAGDGRLTRLIAPHFHSVLAIEKNSAFSEQLARIPNAEPVFVPIQDFTPPRLWDIALLSYSLSGIPPEQLGTTLSRLFEHRRAGGRMLVVTYQDGCGWDQFAGGVYSALGIARSGGVHRHSEELVSAGFRVTPISALNTHIWAPSERELLQTLGFFFHRAGAQYYENPIRFLSLLEPHLVNLSNRGVAIPVVEQILEVSPREGER
jgi:hypothetical protein